MSGPVGCATRCLRTSPTAPEVDGRLYVYSGEERLCSGGDENHQVGSWKHNKSYRTPRKICVSLVPVEYVEFIYWLSETSSGPGRRTASCSLTWSTG